MEGHARMFGDQPGSPPMLLEDARRPIVFLLVEDESVLEDPNSESAEEAQEADETEDEESQVEDQRCHVYGAYKPVDRRVKPVPGVFPEDARVVRQFPEDPLASLQPLTPHPPDFVPTMKLTRERMEGLKINADGFLWPEEEKLLKHIFSLNEKVLAFEEGDRGTFREDYFSPYIIPTIPHVPWMDKNIPIPPGIREQVIELLRGKLEAGVYERCQSSYRSKWFCVLKKNGKLRLVHDLQPLNAITIRDAGLPPSLDDFVEPFAGRQCYTVLDLFWAFDARKLDIVSRDLTAFHSPLGLLHLTSMPMGFTNSPAEFQAYMTFILQDEIPHVANVFIDDLPIKGPATCYPDSEGNPEVLKENEGIRRFIWEHANDVHRILHRVGHAGITFSGLKAQVCKPDVIIVGQKCTPEGRMPEDDKVDKIRNWPVPRTVKDVRGFIGLCGTVRIWIKDFSEKVRPLRELTLQKAEFIWDDRRQSAFDELKGLVSSAPALRPIDYSSSNPVILSVDSSKYAVGFILSQIDDEGKRRPARYGSLPMNETESNYSQPKLELYGLYRALRRWRLYLVGVKTLHVEVDAKYIKGMLNEPDLQLNATINRWIQGILLFDFKLVHVPAAQHKGPDALSRRPLGEGEVVEEDDGDEWLDNIALYIGTTPSEAKDQFEMLSGYDETAKVYLTPTTTQDQVLRMIFRFLSDLEVPEFSTPRARFKFLRKCHNYFAKDGVMYRRYAQRMPVKVVFEENERRRILEEAHDQFGHKGVRATFETVQLRFFWPFYHGDVRCHVGGCRECQIRSVKKVEVPLIISTPVDLFYKVYMDVMFMPTVRGYNCIMACRDDLSGVTEARALKGASSKEVAKFFWEQIICRYGAVHHVVTDNGSETKGAFEALVRRYRVHHIRISPYNSKANGVVGRGHFILREALIKSCGGNISRWPELLPLAVFADRISIRRATGFSPYFLLHGVHPVLPMDLRESTFMVEGFRRNMSHADLLALRIRQLERRPEDVARAAEILRMSRLTSKEHFEKRFAHRIRKEVFESGDLVLVRNSAIEREMNRKHKPRYLGPYEIVRRTQNGSYVIKELNGDVSRESVAAFRLLAYQPSDRNLESLISDPIDAVDNDETQPEEDVLGSDEEEGEDLHEIVGKDSSEEESEDEMDMLPVSQRTRSWMQG
ncbi:hypothetical protein ONZ51_g10761 [Trametes cubensis]|uniref:Integrase catalytic domain-containing protein n=1 Tax=Trametes cubensis TaxID=1111947 RepID=A0AAD7TJE8_9APHY|nr:hypothetical protein ONZ51_g10761 [Trametes cubensis]